MMRSKSSFDFAGPIADGVSGGTDCAETLPARASGNSATEMRKYLLMQNGDNAASVCLNWIHSGLHLLYTGRALESFRGVKASITVFSAELFRALAFRLDLAAVFEARRSRWHDSIHAGVHGWIGQDARRMFRNADEGTAQRRAR